MELAPQPDFEFIHGALRDLFRFQRQDLARMLTKLAVLEIRFQREYLGGDEINWVRCFDTNTNLFDSVATISPSDLANSLTADDIIAFQQLSPQNIIREDFNLQHVHRRWNRLCRAVQESIAVNSGLYSVLADLARASTSSLLLLFS